MDYGFIIALRYSGTENGSQYLIWYEDEKENDCVFAVDKRIMFFLGEEAAKNRFEELGLEYADTEVYDVKRLLDWINSDNNSQIYLPNSSEDEIDCVFLINFWNLFIDIAYSIGIDFEPEKTNESMKCYDKLFWGLNLPAVTPDGCSYSPVFTKEELNYIKSLMLRGIDIYKKNSDLYK